MLKSLSIQNYALIRQLDLQLDQGLVIITGETGAGKSILLGALGLVAGERADSTVVDGHASKCVVEAEFGIEAYGLEPFFEELELDYEPLCILRREISIQGKSRAFINDTPVSIQQLRELGERLIDIHSQHETLSLKERSYQIQLLDAYAANETLLQEYRNALDRWTKLKGSLEALIIRENEMMSTHEFNLYQLNELKEFGPKAGESGELETELERLEHAADIARTAFSGAEALKLSEGATLEVLHALLHNLKQVSRFEPRFVALEERLHSVSIELDDLASELEQIAANTQADDARLLLVSGRLDRLNGLLRKHQVNDSGELLARMHELEDLIARVDTLDEEKQSLLRAVEDAHRALVKVAGALHASRMKAVPGLVRVMQNLLAEVGMPHTRLELNLEDAGYFAAEGPDQINLLFSPNPGAPLLPLNKVASGGELSRLMLCFKSVLAASRSLPTLIFDEIDTGISGEIAARVGKRMKQMSQGHQVICITHLPQIAGCGDSHYLVYKETDGGKTSTGLRKLNDSERVAELARILSGDKLSESAMANARELLGIR